MKEKWEEIEKHLRLAMDKIEHDEMVEEYLDNNELASALEEMAAIGEDSKDFEFWRNLAQAAFVMCGCKPSRTIRS